MFENEADFEKIVDQLNIDTEPNRTHRESLRQQMLFAFNESRRATRTALFWRTTMKSKITKLAAAAVIIIAILASVHYFSGHVNITAPALADVIEQIRKARSVAYKKTFHPGEDREFTTENMINELGVMRSVLPHGVIIIHADNKTIQLRTKLKQALLTHRVGRKRGNRLFNRLEWVSKLHEEGGEFEGQEEVDGKMADVFVVEMPFDRTTVWVDPEINLPVRVEMVSWPNPDKDIITPKMSLDLSDFGGEGGRSSITISSGRGSPEGIQDEMTTVMSDFVWNVEVDESLFSLKPPEGYTLEEKQFDVSEMGENDLIKALAFWTEMSAGMFPSRINDLGDPNQVRPLLIAKFDADADPKEELEQAMQQMNSVLKGLMFAQQCKVDGSWYYAGEGVRLSDADTPVCWWKSKDSDDYRVIYADLSIGDLPAEQLPESP